ncbi:MAG: Protein GrpE [Chlamydiia bacterium]|nr:Protein GrpE [Chlamydiia bacterium]
MKKEDKNKEAEESIEEKDEKIISPTELIQEQLMQRSKEATEYKDKYFRALAEMENVKKRLMQEKKELIAYSVGNFVEELLGPIDNLENALGYTDNLSDEMKNWAVGFKMILDQFKNALESNGIAAYESIGKPFDPNFHEAVELIETNDHEDGVIIEELMKGYRQDKRIIRVAKVKVAKKISSKESKKEEQNK